MLLVGALLEVEGEEERIHRQLLEEQGLTAVVAVRGRGRHGIQRRRGVRGVGLPVVGLRRVAIYIVACWYL